MVMGIILAIAVVAYAEQQKKGTGKVQITDTSIVIHPSIKLSEADAKKMDAILAKHRKDLYKIDTVQNGKLVKTQGELKDAKMGEALKAEVAAAESKSGQMALAGGKSVSHVRVFCPFPPCGYVMARRATEGKQLVEELKSVLQKY